MTKRILYFTAGAALTEQEKADIEALNALAEPQYRVTVHNGDVDPDYLVPGDFAAGAVPDDYEELPVFDPENPPGPELPDTQAIVTDGQSLEVEGGTVTLAVEDGVVSATFTPEG